MYSHSVSISNSVVRGRKPIVVGFLRVQISSNGKMCFVVPVSNLTKQALHVTARGISHEPPKGKTNSGTTLTAVASYSINGSSTSSCWLPCDQSPHCLDYLDHGLPATPQAGSLTSEEPRLKSHNSSSGESWRDWCAVKIQDIDNLKESLRLCWGHISQHRVAKAIRPFTKRLKGCIASRGGRFEHRLQ